MSTSNCHKCRTQIQETGTKKQVQESKYKIHTKNANKEKEIKTCTHQETSRYTLVTKMLMNKSVNFTK